jgi:hypothetical protein
VAPLTVTVGLAYAPTAARSARRERTATVTEISLANGTSIPLPAVAAVSGMRSAERRRN